MLKQIRKSAEAAQSQKLSRMGAMGSLKAAKKGEAAPRKYATGGTVDMPIDGASAKPRLDRPGRKAPGKGKDKKAGTNVNIIIAPKPDAPKAPDMPMAGGPGPMPPMPMPPAPPAGGPPPMPMRKTGGKVHGYKTGGKVVKRDMGGEVDEPDADDQREYQVAGKFSGLSRAAGAAAKAAGSASKGASGAAKVVPKVAPSARDVGNVILESEALMNGTPGARIGTGRRAIWDGLNLMTRKKPADQQKDDPNQQPPQKKKTGGKVMAHDDKAADEKLIKSMVRPESLKSKKK